MGSGPEGGWASVWEVVWRRGGEHTCMAALWMSREGAFAMARTSTGTAPREASIRLDAGYSANTADIRRCLVLLPEFGRELAADSTRQSLAPCQVLQVRSRSSDDVTDVGSGAANAGVGRFRQGNLA